MKCKQLWPGFEHELPCPFSMTLIVTSWAPPFFKYVFLKQCIYFDVRYDSKAWLIDNSLAPLTENDFLPLLRYVCASMEQMASVLWSVSSSVESKQNDFVEKYMFTLKDTVTNKEQSFPNIDLVLNYNSIKPNIEKKVWFTNHRLV